MKEEDFFRKLKKESILIYGAGMVGKLVYSRLMSAGMGEKVKGFAVTCKKEEGCRSCLGVPLYRIDELVSCGESVDVIAAAMPALQKEILEELHRRKFPNVWEISPDLYEDLARSYMQKFREKNPFPEKEIDVLFMASDNNSSSGAFLCMAELNTELNRRGMSTAVILPEYGNGAAILEQQGIPYTYVPSRHWCRRSEENWAWKRPSALKAASDLTQPSGQAQEGTHAIEEDTNAIEETAQIIRKGHVKVVHNNTTYAHTGALAARLAGIPYVWHIRENIAAQGFCFMEEGKARELFSQAAGVAAVSAYVASCYRGLSPSRTQVIYDGVDVRKYVRRDKELFRGNCVSILLAGVVTPLKRQEDLVEAAGFLKKWGIPFRVRFAGSGEGDYMSFLGRRVKELGLEHEVEFCGRQDSLEKYYQEADIVAVCSGAEAFGRTTVEAQLAGCLVAGARAGATPELIEDGKTGFLYQCGDSRELAEKIRQALQNPEEAGRMARRGQLHALAHYSLERCTEQVLELYQRAVPGFCGRIQPEPCREKEPQFCGAVQPEPGQEANSKSAPETGREYYARETVSLLRRAGRLAVFGAGTVALEVGTCLIGAPYFLDICCFLVSRPEANPAQFLGRQVVSLDRRELLPPRDTLVVVASMERSLESITICLHRAGFYNLLYLTFESDLWSCIRGNYYIEYCRRNRKEYLILDRELPLEGDIKDAEKVSIYSVRSHADRVIREKRRRFSWEIPIQAGAALSPEELCQVRDHRGENISSKNREYCELTALYWIWKNTASEYVGLCHYRRHFVLDSLQLARLSRSDIHMVVTVPVLNFPSVGAVYAQDHIQRDWEVMMEGIEKLCPEYRGAAECIRDGIYYYAYNMFIARRPVLDEYCSWLFPLLSYCEKHCAKKEDPYQNRHIGFLAERLMTVYIKQHEDRYKIVHAEKHFIERYV